MASNQMGVATVRPLCDVSNSPRARHSDSRKSSTGHSAPEHPQRSVAAPAQVSAEVMRKADQMLVRATEQIVARNEKIAELQAELRAVKRRARYGGEEVSDRRLQALRREYEQAEDVRELRLADAQMQVHRHERNAQHLQHRVDEQAKEIASLMDRVQRSETGASSLTERHSAAMSKLQNELTQMQSTARAEAAAAARELRAAREKLHVEEAAREAAAQMAKDELQEVQAVMRAEAEQLGAAQERNDELGAEVRALQMQLQAADEQRRLDLEASSAMQRDLANEAASTTRQLEDTRDELCEMEQAADTAMAGWNEEKDVRVRLQNQVAQKAEADAAAAAMEQSMALVAVAEMQQLKAEKARLTDELQQIKLLHRAELDALKVQLADAVCKVDASERASKKQIARQQEEVVAKTAVELESVRAQLRSQREVEDALSTVNRELDDVRAQLADEIQARLAVEAKWEEARNESEAMQSELETLKQEQELQELVASSVPPSLPSPSPIVRIDISELEQEKELRVEAEKQAEQERTIHCQTKTELEQAVALGEAATNQVEALTTELAAAQKGRGALLLEIEHQHEKFTEANERIKESEAAAEAALSQAAQFQNEVAAAARLLDAASSGLETEKRRNAALCQQLALVTTEARKTAEMQDAEMRAWVTLGTRYGTRFGSAHSDSTPGRSSSTQQSEPQVPGNNALTPWHTPGMARWPSLSPMSMSRARRSSSKSPSPDTKPQRPTGSAFATLDRCDQLIEQLEHAEEQVEAAAHQQLETVHHLQDDVAKLHTYEREQAGSSVTWADKPHMVGAGVDSPNTVRRVLVTDIRRMLLAPAARMMTPTTAPAAATTDAEGLGQMIAQQQAEQRLKQGSADTSETDDSTEGICGEEELGSVLEQSLRAELDEARMELVAGDRVELAGKAALAGAHRASELVEEQLRKAEARAEQAEQQCRELSAKLAEQMAAVSKSVHGSMHDIIDAEVQPNPEVDPEPESEPDTQLDPEPESERETQLDPEPEPEAETELDPEPEPEPEPELHLKIVPSGTSLVQRMKAAHFKTHEPISTTLVHRMKALASTHEQAQAISDAANAAVIEATMEVMVARTETSLAQDQVITMREAATEADERTKAAVARSQEQYAVLLREKVVLTESLERRLANVEEARLHCEERLATALEELAVSHELSENRNKRVNDLEMELATAEDKIVGLRDELAQAVDASLAASRNKVAMVEEWKAQRASLKSELKDCNMCRDALVAENDGLRRQLRAEGKPGTLVRTPNKKLTLRKESDVKRSKSVLRQTVGAEKSPQTTPARPRWNRV